MSDDRVDRSGNSWEHDAGVVEQLMSGAEMLPTQLSTPSRWSPESQLAGAVLALALADIRDGSGDQRYQRRVQTSLRWVLSDDVQWPFSFVPLCHLFGLEPDYVRDVVKGWHQAGASRLPRQSSADRHAA